MPIGFVVGAMLQPRPAPSIPVTPTPVVAASPAPTLQNLSNQFVEVVEKVSPSVVSIDAIQVVAGYQHPFSDPFSTVLRDEVFAEERKIPSVGSGVLVGDEGYILTNHHVIKGVREIRVTLADDRVAPATWVGSDAASDLAVLKVELGALKGLPWGDSDGLKAGEFVLAFGSPFRMRGSVSHGIVSGKGRRDLGIADFENFIQTDAAINPGNSGGPLCNLKGEVVGINTAMLTKTGGSQGIGLAIPSQLARSVYEDIVKSGRVDRAWLGLWVEPVTPELAAQLHLPCRQGVLVQGGYRSGPAGRAGFQAFDVIMELNGNVVQDEREFRKLLAPLPIGKEAEFMVWRQGRGLKLKLKPESRASDSSGRPARGL
ncbi:trypsin-like peptidase domain-containing protein [bacterium]|nr:trypsin-like peptidase domain-containing protein [bacterium]